MNRNPIFDQARTCINRSLIESLLPSPGAYWTGDEYFTLNPARGDTKIGSFHINAEGQWFDHATSEGGDLIGLLAEAGGCTKAQAAEKIVKAAGGVVPQNDPTIRVTHNNEKEPAKRKNPKPAPVIPIPAEARDSLNILIRGAKHGSPVGGWRYTNAAGEWLFSIVRYDNADGKQVIPYYWAGERWVSGQAFDDARPLYGLMRLAENPDAPVLLVEGEKCADVKVPGFVVVTWPGGSSAVKKVDFSPLDGREVTIWPDHDEAGRKASDYIAGILPDAETLDVWSYRVDNAPLSDAWDIADAEAAGWDVRQFITDCTRVLAGVDEAPPSEPESDAPFRCLGYTDDSHHFLIRDRVVVSIPRGGFNASKTLQLAPLDWWAMSGMTSNGDGLKVAYAQDYLQRESSRAGRFDELSIRGAGVWRDGDRVIINDGMQIIAPDGTRTAYDDFKSRHHYVGSSTRFGSLEGEEATAEDGYRLMRLWDAQQWADSSHSLASLGWALIAPHGGVLSWRPHVWVSGRKGTGKSWVLENLIVPLVGDFAHEGSGKDTEAGIRRVVRRDARPVILDEMEPRTKNDRENIDRILALARNASSNHSARVTMAARDGGTESFVIRSCFAFASVQVPEVDAAVSSRILRCELKPAHDFATKRGLSNEYLSAISNPARYRLRIFRRIPRMLEDIEFARNELLPALGDQRQADQWAPLVAAVWHLHKDETMQSDEGRKWCRDMGSISRSRGETDMSDEDAVWNYALSHRLDMGPGEKRSVAELLLIVAGLREGDMVRAKRETEQFGLRIKEYEHRGVSKRVLAVAGRSPVFEQALNGTMYAEGYGSQVKRNDLCLTPTQERCRIGGRVVGAYMLDWDGFVEKYLGVGDE